MNLNELSKEIYEANKLKGFDVAKDNKGQVLMLIVSELAEAFEAVRKEKNATLDIYFKRLEEYETNSALCNHLEINRPFEHCFEMYIKDSFEDEIADSIIRLLDLCGGLNIDIDTHIALKRRYNRTRPYKHGKKF